MEQSISKSSLDFFNGCDLAKSITGETPTSGTRCWIFAMDVAGNLNQKCDKCPYYLELQKSDDLKPIEKSKYALVKLPEAVNDKRVQELKKLLDTLVAKNCKTILLDCSNVLQIYSAGLGVILRVFKILKEKQGNLYIVNPTETLRSLLQTTMLIKILPVVNSESAVEAQLVKLEQEIASGEAKAKEELKKQKLEESKAVHCWEYFKGQNPRNVTPCSECHYKHMGGVGPCWIVTGEVEGITFEYVNEDCFECDYYLKYNPEEDTVEL